MVFTVMKGKKETPYVLYVLYLLPLFSFHFFSAAPSFTFQWRLFSIKEKPPFFSLFCLRLFFFFYFFPFRSAEAVYIKSIHSSY
jgi:hypothetical protein